MSHVLSSFRSSVGIAVDHPGHAVLVTSVTLVAMAVSLVLNFVPLVGPVVSNVVIMPLMLAAILGSAHGIRVGTRPFHGMKAGLSGAGKSLVGAFGLLYAVMMALGIAVSLLALLVFVAVVLVGGGAGAEAGMLTAGSQLLMGIGSIVLVGGVLLTMLVVTLFIQFVAPAAVVAETNAVDSLKTSYRFVRQNLVSVLGFTGVVLGVVLLGYLLTAVGFAAGYYAINEIAGIAVGGVVYVVAFGVVGAVLTVYQVEYFVTVADSSVIPSDDDSAGGNGPVDDVELESESGVRTSDSVGDEVGPAFEFAADSGRDVDDTSDRVVDDTPRRDIDDTSDLASGGRIDESRDDARDE